MKIINVRDLNVPEVKVITIQRLRDDRGYFAEIFRQDVVTVHPQLEALHDKQFVQVNESSSSKGVIRGLHTQSHPNLDKLLRIIKGRIVDFAVDIRPKSPTFGQAAAIELAYDKDSSSEDMVMIPFGFAHGILVLEDCHIQYFQTGTWNKAGEASILITDPEISWSGCPPELAEKIQQHFRTAFLSPKDSAGLKLSEWKTSELAQNYIA